LWGTDFRICIQFFQLFFVEIIQLAGYAAQKIQVAPLKNFLYYADLQSLARRNVRATAYFHADANAPAGSQRQHMPFAVTTFPVKTQCRAVRRPPGIALL
jgi:hypothetical protein